MKKNIIAILIIVLFAIPSILPLFNKGFFQSDDGEWMVIRATSFYSALKDWQFPVRFLSSLNHGYGYPVANFLYPGFMYLSVPIHLLGFGFVDTIKIILGVSIVTSAIFSFLWLSKLFNKFPAFIGSMLYLYLPYHLYDIYKRGSVGETLALVIVPFILWQIEKKSFFWPGFGIGWLIISHNTLSLLFLPLIVIYMFVRKKISANLNILSLLLGIGSSAYFSIPAIFDLQYTVFFKTKISQWQNYFVNIDLINYLSIIILVLGIIVVVKKKSKSRTLLFIISGLISIFLATETSQILWRILPISFIQFPFRLLSVTILTVSYLASLIIDDIKGLHRYGLGIILLILILTTAFKYQPSAFFNKSDSYYSTNEDTTTVKNEYLPIWVKNNPIEHYKNKVEIAQGTVYNLEVRPNSINFDVNSPEPTKITINTIYFPGWKFFMDSNNLIFNYENEKGVIQFNMPAGIHRVIGYFSETPVRLIADIISAVCSLGLLIIVLNREKEKASEYS